MNQVNGTKDLLDFIISQRLDFGDLPKLKEILPTKFSITQNGEEATCKLVDFIINWEENTYIYDSLESLLRKNFEIFVR